MPANYPYSSAEEIPMADDNGMEELRAIVTRLALLVERLGDRQEQADERFAAMAARWDAMAQRWDGYIVEQREFNQSLQMILERLLPGSGDGRQEA
jgi:hypothetical protein